MGKRSNTAELEVPYDVLEAAAERANQEYRSLTDVTATLLRDYAGGRTWLNLPGTPRSQPGTRQREPAVNDEELIARARQLAEDGVRSAEAQALARELLRQMADRLEESHG